MFDHDINIRDLVNVTGAKTHDRYGLEQTIFAKNTTIVLDRAYFDFALMLNRIIVEIILVTRIKSNSQYQITAKLELPIDTDQDILIDEIIVVLVVKPT